MPLFNPIYKLSSLIITIVVKRTKLPSLFIGLSTQLFYICKNLFRTQGYFSTLLVLNRIHREILNNGNLSNLINYTGLNPIVISTLSSILLPNWSYCLQYKDKINQYYKWYIFGMIFTNINRLIYGTIKITVGLIFSSLGILYSDIFSGYTLLKDLSNQFLSLIEDQTNLKFHEKIKLSNNNYIDPINKNISNSKILEETNDKISIFNFLGYIMIGFFLFGSFCICIDLYKPHTFDNIPVIQPFVDSMRVLHIGLFDYIESWFTPSNPTTSTNIEPSNIIPEPIKKSLSGESNSSIGSSSSVLSDGSDKTIRPSSPIPSTESRPIPEFDPWSNFNS